MDKIPKDIMSIKDTYYAALTVNKRLIGQNAKQYRCFMTTSSA